MASIMTGLAYLLNICWGLLTESGQWDNLQTMPAATYRHQLLRVKQGQGSQPANQMHWTGQRTCRLIFHSIISCQSCEQTRTASTVEQPRLNPNCLSDWIEWSEEDSSINQLYLNILFNIYYMYLDSGKVPADWNVNVTLIRGPLWSEDYCPISLM